jgi:hypothetical protein
MCNAISHCFVKLTVNKKHNKKKLVLKGIN